MAYPFLAQLGAIAFRTACGDRFGEGDRLLLSEPKSDRYIGRERSIVEPKGDCISFMLSNHHPNQLSKSPTL
jgi:hypothetical protein